MAFFDDALDTVALMSPVGLAVGITKAVQGDQPADMKAMNDFFVRQEPRTKKADELKTGWNVWYNDLSWYEKTMDKNIMYQARNKVAEFERANTTSQAELDKIIEMQKRGAQLEMEIAASKGQAIPLDTKGNFAVPKARDPLANPKDLKIKWILLGASSTIATALGAYASPIGKIPLGLASLLSFLGTSTYVAFNVED